MQAPCRHSARSRAASADSQYLRPGGQELGLQRWSESSESCEEPLRMRLPSLVKQLTIPLRRRIGNAILVNGACVERLTLEHTTAVVTRVTRVVIIREAIVLVP